jgi:hypothetical protein
VFYPFLDFGLALATAIPQALFQNFQFDGDVDDTCLRIAASGFFDNGAGNVDDDNPALFQVIVDRWGDSVRSSRGRANGKRTGRRPASVRIVSW